MIGRDPLPLVIRGSSGSGNPKSLCRRRRSSANHDPASMATIRDLVSTVRQREGVTAAVVLGRDGLLIDGQATAGIDTDGLAAVVPAVLTAGDELGEHAGGGALATCVLEYEGRVIIVCSLTTDAILVVVASEEADIGKLLFELRRNRRRIAAIM
ncbi:MAG: roadblock/LC7 domain-containing protein [Anaerolineae bacterium]|nr:roadblock/LC7 domain-containing protein [Gemmatimonadaceae bacterium]